jgi:ankyrin repeat protein
MEYGNLDQTPLHAAAEKGNTKAVKALIKNGADVNAKDHDRWTPLH